ncbi:Mce-associated membrane protein [Rhodococcus koreensis]|uniref:Mce-associated membrane protein n=1 Tax=Rhodococcus koreensis TaxID=99653 RepID=A0A1H4Z835_9NOCA|nr:Mce-associated membrane protein [Rhodococcus koreensis]
MTRITTPPESGQPAPGKDRTLKASFAAVTALVVIAVVAAGWFGFGWARALFVDKPIADARDSALTGAQQAAINLNSVDSADLDGSFENMKSSITGDKMNQDLQATVDGFTDQMRQSGAASKAELIQGTLTELNTDDGTAKALVVVAVTTTWPDRFDKAKVTMRMDVQDVDGVWKASSVEPVGGRIPLESGPVPAAGAAPAPAPTEPAPAEQAPAEQVPEGDSSGQ